MRDVIVSTHFDDAVLSLFSVLAERAEHAVVLTVCGGVPPAGALSTWDAAAGFASGADAAHARRRENVASCALTGAIAIDLPFLDGPYGALDGSAVRAVVLSTVAEGDRLWIPAGIGRHPDHLAVRSALATVGATVYADGGYAGRWLHPPRAAAGTVGRVVRRRLDDAMMAAKIDAVRAHASQIRGLTDGFPDLLDPHGRLRRERWWPARGPTMPPGR